MNYKDPKENRKEINSREIKENRKEIIYKEPKENMKEISYKKIKENKKEIRHNNEKEISKSYNDIFINISKKQSNNTDYNRKQDLLSSRNMNKKEQQSKNVESKSNIKNAKIKERKAKIKKFNVLENRKEMNNISLQSRNKPKKKKYNFDEIPLDKYKMYLDYLFSENNNSNEIYNNTVNNNNRDFPLNYYSLNKSKNNIYSRNNYTLDNNITNSNYFDEPTSKKAKKIKNKKNNNISDKYVNNFLNTLSNNESYSKNEKNLVTNNSNLKNSVIKNGMIKHNGKKRKNHLMLEYQNSNDNEMENLWYNYTSQKPNKIHKRIKSVNDEENLYNKRQIVERKNNFSKENYMGQNRSYNLVNNNSKSPRKIRIVSKEKYNYNTLGKDYGLNNTIPKNKNKDKDILNQIYINDKLKNSYSFNNSYNSNSLENAKNKLKDKLISVTDELKSEILKYYIGPINVECISSKNLDESVNDLIYKIKMNGYKYIKIKDYVFKCTKEDICYSIELVKIKGNLYYYLMKKE